MSDEVPRARPRVRVRALRLPHAEDLEPPSRGSARSAGLDLRAAISAPLTIHPGQRARVATGWRLEIPAGWEGQVRPRSGLALEFGITIANSPGTIDADYRGEVAVLLINLGDETVTIERGQRIAQLVVVPVAEVTWDEIGELGDLSDPGDLSDLGDLSDTARGEGGFGSTGR